MTQVQGFPQGKSDFKLFKKKVIGLNCMKPKANMSSISEKTEQVGQKRNDIPWNLAERSTC